MIRQEKVDVAILGAGGAGYPAAFRLAAAGRSVMMVDPYGNLGGNCLAEGCVPSKAVREAAVKRRDAAKYPVFGLRGPVPEADWPKILAHKDRVQNIRYRQHTEEIEESSVRFHKGRGTILDPHTVEVMTEAGEVFRYQADYLILGTGAAPSLLPIEGAEHAITSHHLFRLGADLSLPRRLVIIGGGYIGLECASMLQIFGSEVTVLEALPEVMAGADAGLAKFLHEALARRVEILVSARVTAIRPRPGLGYTVHFETGGTEQTREADLVLMATGRRPVLPPGIEALGLSARGPVAVDETLRTALPHVYAPGDINGRSMLFHSAVAQSLIVAENILRGGRDPLRMNFQSVAFTVFTEPEIAFTGMSRAAAEAAGIETVTARYDYRIDSRAQIMDEMEGFIDLVFEARTRRLIGAQVAGLDAAQVIAPLALAVDRGVEAEALSLVAFPHPMISEGINKAARKVWQSG